MTFLSQISPCAVGVLKGRFWTELVPQLTRLQPSIMYATLAINSLVMSMRHTSQADISSERCLPLVPTLPTIAIQHHNRAIASTASSIRDNSIDTTIALVTTALFFCIEILQSNDSEALRFVQQGHQILWETPNHGAIVMSIVAPLLGRLQLVAAFLGLNLPKLQSR